MVLPLRVPGLREIALLQTLLLDRKSVPSGDYLRSDFCGPVSNELKDLPGIDPIQIDFSDTVHQF